MVKDVWSGRIVGYFMGARMQARLAVQALENAVAPKKASIAPERIVLVRHGAGRCLCPGARSRPVGHPDPDVHDITEFDPFGSLHGNLHGDEIGPLARHQ